MKKLEKLFLVDNKHKLGKIPLKLSLSNFVFVFGHNALHSLGSMEFILHTPSGLRKIKNHIVAVSISFLSAFDTLGQWG